MRIVYIEDEPPPVPVSAPMTVACTVTFHANGGAVSPTTRAVTRGRAVGALPTPTRSGYSFVGWFSAASGGTQISAETVVTASVTYYAHWMATQYTESFDRQGGSGGMLSVTVTYGSALPSISVPTRAVNRYRRLAQGSRRSRKGFSAR